MLSLVVGGVLAGPDEVADSSFGVLVGGKVFHILSAEGVDKGVLCKCINMAGVSWRFLAVIIEGVSVGTAREFLGGGGDKLAVPLVVVEVVVGAYGGEGFINWYPNA